VLQQLGTSSANTTCRQLVNRFVTTCLQTCNNWCVFTCVVPVDKSGTSFYRLVTRLMRPIDSQQVVPTSLISSAHDNKLMTTSSSQLVTNSLYILALLYQVCYSHQSCNKVVTTCSRLLTTTGNKQCEHILTSAWQLDLVTTCLRTACLKTCYKLVVELNRLVTNLFQQLVIVLQFIHLSTSNEWQPCSNLIK
jgi:hypothetical protein